MRRKVFLAMTLICVPGARALSSLGPVDVRAVGQWQLIQRLPASGELYALKLSLDINGDLLLESEGGCESRVRGRVDMDRETARVRLRFTAVERVTEECLDKPALDPRRFVGGEVDCAYDFRQTPAGVKFGLWDCPAPYPGYNPALAFSRIEKGV